MEFKEELDIFRTSEVQYREDAVEKFLKKEGISDILRLTKECLEKIEGFTALNIEVELRALVEKLGLKAGDLIHPLRVAVTGKSVSAGIFEVLELLGKERVLKRLEYIIRQI